MKRILTTLKEKWPEYLLEILVLIVGIYGAFVVDNWNEDRKERNLEHNYLRSIYSDLNKDLAALEAMYQYRLSTNEIAYKIISTERVSNTFEDQLAFSKQLIQGLYWFEFTPNDNTLKELLSSGNLSIIKNDKIKSGLLDLEALNDEIIKQQNHIRLDYEKYLYDELFNLNVFDLIDFDHVTKTRDLNYLNALDQESLKAFSEMTQVAIENKKVQNGWKLIIINNADILDSYDQMNLKITQLQEEIEIELQSR